VKSLTACLGSFALAACAGLGPSPDQIAAAVPPEVELDAAQREQVALHTAAALARMNDGEFAAADAAARAALRIDPRAARAIAVRARSAMAEGLAEEPPRLGSWQRAEGLFRLALRLQPADPEIVLMHAHYLEADGHLSAAAAAVGDLLAGDPENQRALRETARLQYELGAEETALPLLQRVIEIDPGADQMRYRLAQCQLRLARTAARGSEPTAEKIERFAEVARSFQIYRERVADDAAGYTGEAVARFAALRLDSDPETAALESIVSLLARAGELDPRSPEPDFNRGVVLEFADDATAAQDAYRAALERDPEHLPSLLNLAALLGQAGATDEAVALCRRALRLGVTPGEKSRLEAFLAEQG